MANNPWDPTSGQRPSFHSTRRTGGVSDSPSSAHPLVAGAGHVGTQGEQGAHRDGVGRHDQGAGPADGTGPAQDDGPVRGGVRGVSARLSQPFLVRSSWSQTTRRTRSTQGKRPTEWTALKSAEQAAIAHNCSLRSRTVKTAATIRTRYQNNTIDEDARDYVETSEKWSWSPAGGPPQ